MNNNDLSALKERIFIGLVHHPIVNKKGETVTTSVTNLDIHDISRTCQTYGIINFFIITPLQKQHELVKRITHHWTTDVANEYNPTRQDALSYVKLSNTIEEAQSMIEKIEGKKPFTCITAAGLKDYSGDEKDLAQKIKLDKSPILLLFGTGWGLSACVLKAADYSLRPIFGRTEEWSNHLSVRSAVAIYSDRIVREINQASGHSI